VDVGYIEANGRKASKVDMVSDRLWCQMQNMKAHGLMAFKMVMAQKPMQMEGRIKVNGSAAYDMVTVFELVLLSEWPHTINCQKLGWPPCHRSTRM